VFVSIKNLEVVTMGASSGSSGSDTGVVPRSQDKRPLLSREQVEKMIQEAKRLIKMDLKKRQR
jgi:hypothetical protein